MASRKKSKPPKGSLSDSVIWRSTGALKIGNLARRNEKQKLRLRKVKSTISNRLEPSVSRARKSRLRRAKKRKPVRRSGSARASSAPSSQEPISSAWIRKYHERKERHYWYNVETRETCWTRPTDLPDDVGIPDAGDNASQPPELIRVRDVKSVLSPRARRAAQASAKRANSPRVSRKKTNTISLMDDAISIISSGRPRRPLPRHASPKTGIKPAWVSPPQPPSPSQPPPSSPSSAPTPEPKVAFVAKPRDESRQVPRGATKSRVRRSQSARRRSGPKSDDIPSAISSFHKGVSGRSNRPQNRISLRKRAMVVGTGAKTVLSPRVRRAARASANKVSKPAPSGATSFKRAAAMAVAIAPPSSKEQKQRWKEILVPLRVTIHKDKTHLPRLKIMLYSLDRNFSGMANSDKIREKLKVLYPQLSEQEWAAIVGLFDMSGTGEMEYMDMFSLLSRMPEITAPPEPEPEPEPEPQPEPEPELTDASEEKDASGELKVNEAKMQDEAKEEQEEKDDNGDGADVDAGDEGLDNIAIDGGDGDGGGDGDDDGDGTEDIADGDRDAPEEENSDDLYQDDAFDDDSSEASESPEDEPEDGRPLKEKLREELNERQRSDFAAAVRDAADKFAVENRWLPMLKFRAVVKTLRHRLRMSRLDWQTIEAVFGLTIQADFGKDVNCIDYEAFLNFYLPE